MLEAHYKTAFSTLQLTFPLLPFLMLISASLDIIDSECVDHNVLSDPDGENLSIFLRMFLQR
jgi:hypothetical protein